MKNQFMLDLNQAIILAFALLAFTFLNGFQSHPVETIDKASKVFSFIAHKAGLDSAIPIGKAASPVNPAPDPSDSEVKTGAGFEMDEGSNLASANNHPTQLADKTPPTVTITGVTPGATYILGSVPEPVCVATDMESNVDVPALPSIAGGPVGAVTVHCSSATDYAGNISAQVSVTYHVIENN
jgi:hypothetical protein